MLGVLACVYWEDKLGIHPHIKTTIQRLLDTPVIPSGAATSPL